MRNNLPASFRTWRKLLALTFLLSAVAFPSAGGSAIAQVVNDPRATSGEWDATIDWGIFGKHMALLPNGKVLVWPTGQDAFVWDPVTGEKTAVPASFGDLHCAAQTTLADGRVLVAGGVIVSPHDGITVTAIFDPATNLWANATPMNVARWYGTTTTLPDGRVLITSGDVTANGDRANVPEIYDPATDTWMLLPDTAYKDLGLYPNMFVLPNGKVYNAGTKASTYLLDTTTGVWSSGPTNAFGSSGYAESSAMYAPGKIIRSGGGDPSFANAAIIDMTAPSPQWKQISSMNFPRRRHNMVLLADGSVMAVGGTRQADDLGDGIATGAVYEGEIWNPTTEQWTVTARMTYDRMYHSAALLLPDGRVLVAGGEYNGRKNAQIFSPPYLFKGARPTIGFAPTTTPYGQSFSIDVATDGSSIAGVALIRPSAVTHAFDQNQRYVPLTFTQSGNTLDVSAPQSANYAPPGYYMLVVTDSKGVPSVAKWVRVDTAANLIPGSLIGNVTDAGTGDPIEGVSVSYNGNATTTDTNGDYSLDNVNPGEVQLTFSKSGYATIKRSQAVTGGATVTLNVALAPPGTIAGKVINSETGEGIAGAIVTHGGGTVTTDNGGSYTIAAIPSGDQIVSAAAAGYNSSPDLTVGVPANDTADFDIVLAPKPTFIAGELIDKVTKQTIPDAIVTAGSVSATTDPFGRYQLFVPPGTYEMTVSKEGYDTLVKPGVAVTFGTYTAVDFTLDPINPPVTFTPLADTYANSSVPASNYGSSSYIRVQKSSSTTMNGYLRFDVSGLTRLVRSAKVRLYVTNASGQAGSIYRAENTSQATQAPWSEGGLNYGDAPAIVGDSLSTGAAAPINTWVEFDVTAAVNGDGLYNFALKTTSSDDVRYSSKEGANPPQLVIQQAPQPTIDSFAPDSGPAGTEVTIIGENFGGITGVTFDGTPASSFTVDSATHIRAIVPEGATSGKIGIVTLGGTLATADSFTVIVPPPGPSISSVNPPSGPVGTEVTIAGANFTGVTGVTFDGAPASSFTVDSATKIRAVVPEGATSGKIAVVTANGQAASGVDFTVTVTQAPHYQMYIPLAMSQQVTADQAASSASFRTFTTGAPELSGSKMYVCSLDER